MLSANASAMLTEIVVTRGHYIPAIEATEDVFEARRRAKSNIPPQRDAEWVIRSDHLGISINDAGFVRKVAHGSEVEHKLFEGDRIRSINGVKVASKQQAYGIIETVQAGEELTLGVNIEQREVRQKLAYVDFLPTEAEPTVAQLVRRVNKTLESWPIKVLSIETVSVPGSMANKESTHFMLGINQDKKTGKKSYGGRGVFYQFLRVWYNEADPTNRVAEVQQEAATLAEAADAAVIVLDKKETPCLVM